MLETTRGSALRFAGRQALHGHQAYRYAGGGEWTPGAQCARSERPDEALAAPTRRGFPTVAIRWEASVRRRWRESSKRSSAPVGAGAPFRGRPLLTPLA